MSTPTCPSCGGLHGAHYLGCYIGKVLQRWLGPAYPLWGTEFLALQTALKSPAEQAAALDDDVIAEVLRQAAPAPVSVVPTGVGTPEPPTPAMPARDDDYTEAAVERAEAATPAPDSDTPEPGIVETPESPVSVYHLPARYLDLMIQQQERDRQPLVRQAVQQVSVRDEEQASVPAAPQPEGSRVSPNTRERDAALDLFIEERVAATDDHLTAVPAPTILEAYHRWAERHDMPKVAPTALGTAMTRVGHTDRRQASKAESAALGMQGRPILYFGIRLKSFAEADADKEADQQRRQRDADRRAVAELRELMRRPLPPPPPAPEPEPAKVKTNNGWWRYRTAPANPSADEQASMPADVQASLLAASVERAERRSEKVVYLGDRPGRELHDPEYRKIVQELIAQGWTYRRTNGNGKGKPRVTSPQGHTYALTNTPSDWRGHRNARSHLRKLGAVL